MIVVALVGKSGTGKSYKALELAHDKEIDYVIDDGLLIKGSKIIAGKSAKREKTKISAVKTALFMEKNHRQDIIKKIEEHNPTRILILGTSDKMVNYISENLKIGPIDETIYIYEISSEEDIKTAREIRLKQGKHVIPVPTFEIKKDFSGYFIDKLKIFGRKKDNILEIAEKSVVRPTFSYMGRFTINDRAIVHMVKYVSGNIKSIHKVSRVKIITRQTGIAINIELILKYGYKIPKTIGLLQKRVKEDVEHMTSLNIISVNVMIKSLEIKN